MNTESHDRMSCDGCREEARESEIYQKTYKDFTSKGEMGIVIGFLDADRGDFKKRYNEFLHSLNAAYLHRYVFDKLAGGADSKIKEEVLSILECGDVGCLLDDKFFVDMWDWMYSAAEGHEAAPRPFLNEWKNIVWDVWDFMSMKAYFEAREHGPSRAD